MSLVIFPEAVIRCPAINRDRQDVYLINFDPATLHEWPDLPTAHTLWPFLNDYTRYLFPNDYSIQYLVRRDVEYDLAVSRTAQDLIRNFCSLQNPILEQRYIERMMRCIERRLILPIERRKYKPFDVYELDLPGLSSRTESKWPHCSYTTLLVGNNNIPDFVKTARVACQRLTDKFSTIMRDLKYFSPEVISTIYVPRLLGMIDRFMLAKIPFTPVA
jgi:hypothetical protein